MNSSCAFVVPRFFALREYRSFISGSSLIPFVLFSRSCNAAFSYCHEQIKNLQYEYCRFLWQGRKASNPGPTVLETVALPAELHPYINYLHPHLRPLSPSSEESTAQRVSADQGRWKERISNFRRSLKRNGASFI